MSFTYFTKSFTNHTQETQDIDFIYNYPLTTRRCCDVESTSMTLTQCAQWVCRSTVGPSFKILTQCQRPAKPKGSICLLDTVVLLGEDVFSHHNMRIASMVSSGTIFYCFHPVSISLSLREEVYMYIRLVCPSKVIFIHSDTPICSCGRR